MFVSPITTTNKYFFFDTLHREHRTYAFYCNAAPKAHVNTHRHRNRSAPPLKVTNHTSPTDTHHHRRTCNVVVQNLSCYRLSSRTINTFTNPTDGRTNKRRWSTAAAASATTAV